MQYILSLTFIGVLTGIVAGILGGGSEILIVPLMTLFGLYSTFKERVGTSLFMLLPPIGVWAGINYYRKGYVDLGGALYLSFLFTMASGLTSYYNTHDILTEQQLQRLFGVFTVICGIYILLFKKKE